MTLEDEYIKRHRGHDVCVKYRMPTCDVALQFLVHGDCGSCNVTFTTSRRTDIAGFSRIKDPNSEFFSRWDGVCTVCADRSLTFWPDKYF